MFWVGYLAGVLTMPLLMLAAGAYLHARDLLQ